MERNLAVLIDFENIAAGTEKEGLGRFNVEALMQRVKDKGRILIARSYADWGRFSRFKQGLLAQNVTMMELTSHGMQDKNRADIALVVDALELAFTRDYIDTFVVVSGDSDFTPMVQKMRELNKKVIGCGTRKSTSRLLINACDEFIFYDSIVRDSSARNRGRRQAQPSGDGKLDMPGALDLLVTALRGLQRENPEPPLAGIVKQAMLRKSPDFSENELGYGSFARFLEAAQKANQVSIERDRKSGGYRVDSVESAAAPADSDDNDEPATDWSDAYLPEGTEGWVQALAGQGTHPLSAPTRMAVLEAIEESVAERKKRRRKVTGHFIADDAKKKLRRTYPDLPLKWIRGLIDGLRNAGLLVHKDGLPVRTVSASFQLNKSALELNEAMLPHWLGQLVEAGCELSNSGLLAELFLGDPARNRAVEEAIAWLATQHTGGEDEAELNAIDLDDLLIASDQPPGDPPTDEVPGAAESTMDDLVAEEPAPEPEPEPEKPKRKRAPRKKKTEEPAAEAPAEEAVPDTTPEAAEDGAAEEPPAEKPKRKRVRRKRTTEEDSAEAEKADA